MSDYMYKDGQPPRDSDNRPGGGRGISNVFMPMLDTVPAKGNKLAESQRSHQRSQHLAGTSWYQYLNINLDDDCECAAFEKLIVPAGEKLRLHRRIPSGQYVESVAWWSCGSSIPIDYEVNLVAPDDLDTPVQAITAGDLQTEVMEHAAVTPANGDYAYLTNCDDMLYIQVVITPPFTDAAGNGYFGDDCNDAPCMCLQVRVQMTDVCFRHELKGVCGMGKCASSVYEDKCVVEEK